MKPRILIKPRKKSHLRAWRKKNKKNNAKNDDALMLIIQKMQVIRIKKIKCKSFKALDNRLFNLK